MAHNFVLEPNGERFCSACGALSREADKNCPHPTRNECKSISFIFIFIQVYGTYHSFLQYHFLGKLYISSLLCRVVPYQL